MKKFIVITIIFISCSDKKNELEPQADNKKKNIYRLIGVKTDSSKVNLGSFK